MKLFGKIFIVLVFMAGMVFSADSGMITGRIIDEKNSEALMGANVLVEGTGLGAASDLDGAYMIYNVAPGTYDLRVSYIGYETKSITGVEVKAGEVATINITMSVANLQMGTVVVEVQASKSSDAFLITKQKKSVNVQDGVSSAQIAKNGDSNAAEAAKRISGVTILDDKYIYVRGLGERYTTTQMNGAPMPSPEPDKRTVPLNMFPSALLESITAMKTYTPDLPGTFAGGNVNIETKAYPDERIIKASLSAGEKTYPLDSQTYYRVKNGNSSFFGYSNFDMPGAISDETVMSTSNYTGTEGKSVLGSIGQSFSRGFELQSTSAGKPISAGLSLGDRFLPSRNLEWGYFLNTTFSNDYSFRDAQINNYSLTSTSLDTSLGMSGKKSGYSTNTGLAFSSGMKIANNHKLSLHYVYTHRSEDVVNLNRGFGDNFDDGVFVTSMYEEKTIGNISLKGDHFFDFLGQHRIEWNLNKGQSDLYQPDLTRVNYRAKTVFVDGEETTVFQMDPYTWSAGTREFTDGIDKNTNFDVNYNLTLKDRFNDKYKFKMGNRVQEKYRQFERRVFYHKWPVLGSPAEAYRINDLSEIGTNFENGGYYTLDADSNAVVGWIMNESTSSADAYKANEDINAQFFMMDVPLSFGIFPSLRFARFIGGVRREDYQMQVNAYNPVTGSIFESAITGDTVATDIDEVDFLPSANLFLQFPHDVNARLSYSHTVARGQFREVAPFAFQEFYGGQITVGYPWLKTTDIHNYDFRLEWFPAAGEVMAVSVFRKKFYNPIEAALIDASGGEIYKTYQNAKEAESWGLELDARKSLSFIPLKYGKTTVATNLTWTKSDVEVDSTVGFYTGATFENEATSSKRSLQGQSDLVFNLSLHYSDMKGFNASVSYNTFSKRIVALGVSGLPDEYEMPFHSLNITASKKLGDFKVSGKVKNLLKDGVEIGHKDPITKEFKTTKLYKTGMSFSLGVSWDI